MTPSNRILLNAGATYAQTACSLVLGLLCGRWVYLALGKDNYGLFSVVGALISFIGFVNSTVILGAGRFFAFAIGVERKRDSEPDLLCKWINVAFNVHIVLPFLLVCIGWPIGCRYVATGLVIDESLRTAAQVVFVCSLFTMFQTMAFGPVFALYTAKQLIFVRNLSGIVLSVFFAAEGWWLLHYSGDRLRAHAVLTCVIQLIVNLALLALAYRQFPEFRIRRRYWFDWKRMKEMCSFSLFSLIGALGPLFSNAGVAIVLNRFGGTALNAAYGASNHIYAKTGTISGAVTEAINPEITTRVGAGDKEAAERLARRECVWSSVLAACVCVPGICFADQVLRLWLQTPPETATLFLEIMLASILTDRISSGYSTLIHANGQIRTYVLTVGLANAARCFTPICRQVFPFDIVVAWMVPAVPRFESGENSFLQMVGRDWHGGLFVKGPLACPRHSFQFLPFLHLCERRFGQFAFDALGYGSAERILGFPLFVVVSSKGRDLVFSLEIEHG